MTFEGKTIFSMISLYSTLFDLVNAENALSKTCRNINKGDVNKGKEEM